MRIKLCTAHVKALGVKKTAKHYQKKPKPIKLMITPEARAIVVNYVAANGWTNAQESYAVGQSESWLTDKLRGKYPMNSLIDLFGQKTKAVPGFPMKDFTTACRKAQ